MSAQYQVRASTPGYAGLREMPFLWGRGTFCSGRQAPAETTSRFSLVDEDGSSLIDFQLENYHDV